MKQSTGKRYRAKIPEELLKPVVLSESHILEASLATLEEDIYNQAVDSDLLLKDLLELAPNLLGFTFSALDDAASARLAEGIYATFPAEPGKYGASLALKVVRNLAHFFGAINYLPSNVVDCQRAIELAPPVLSAIPTLDFPNDHRVDDCAEDKRGGGRFKRPSQRKQKKLSRAREFSAQDDTPFVAIGKEVPRSRKEAEDLGQSVLQDQQRILKFFLETLRRPDMKESIKNAYIPEEVTLLQDDPLVAATPNPIDSGSAIPQDGIPYPIVMPLKAALYFDNADGFGAWTVWMSERACKDLRTIKRRDAKMFRILVNKIKDLSHGHFSEDNQKHLAGNDTDIPVFEAKMTRDTRLIYQVDCLQDFDLEFEKQVLRIFGVYTHAEYDRRLWDAVGRQYANGNREYRRRCVYRNQALDMNNVFLPATFPTQEVLPHQNEVSLLPKLSDEMNEELHSIVNLEHYVNLDQDLMYSLEADIDVSHVFDLSAEEQKIVRHDGSCFVIGRSGTGKTTTALYKMYRNEQRWKMSNQHSSEKIQRPRQLFVTRSPVLSAKVKEEYEGLLRGREIGRLKNYVVPSTAQGQSLEDILDLADEESWQIDLPRRFSQLGDEHFPLFLSSDRLLRLLEADGILSLGGEQFYGRAYDDTLDQDIYLRDFFRSRRQHLVTYEMFHIAYWPHLPQRLTKSLDPALVFSEIMGVIKGSAQILDSTSNYLSRQEYNNLSYRTQAMLSRQREDVYDLFEAYTALKKERRDHDAADRSRAIIHFLRTGNVALPQIHYAYVDEVQDNSMMDILLLRLICHNPNGFLWGGDTAQTISAGSSFRFDDLKAFMHDIEKDVRKWAGTGSIKAVPPKLFQLTRNYRSHEGIASCARTIVKMITHFWEYAIDVLQDELGVVDGRKPLLLTSLNLDELPLEQFLFGTMTDRIKFGANQCILVRDDAALEQFHNEIGRNGTAMTISDSKGLEFDDVLLYNFFEDSPISKARWRVLFNYLPESLGIKCPTFGENLHNGLCLELRLLYVAITRARKRILIADRSEKADIMKTVWEHFGQIEVDLPASGSFAFATSSSANDWLDRADKLFKHKNYMQAMNAYENAQNSLMRGIAEAHYFREKAMQQAMKGVKPSERAQSYAVAARAFWKSAEDVLDELNAQAKLFRLAAECYEDAEEDKMAAIAYERAGEYSLSASHYRKAGEFDDAVRVIQVYEVNQTIAESILDTAKLYYLRNGHYQKTFSLFPSDDEALCFFDDYGFDLAKGELLETRSRYVEATEAYAAAGLSHRAATTCLMGEPSPDRDRCAANQLLAALSTIFTLGAFGSSSAVRDDVQGLLNLTKKLDTAVLGGVRRAQLDMYLSIHRRDAASLRSLGRFFRDRDQTSAFLLCFDTFWDAMPKFSTMSISELTTMLNEFLLYAETLRKLEREEDPLTHGVIRKLLNFKESRSGTNRYFIPAGSLLHSEVSPDQDSPLDVTDEGFELSARDLSGSIRSVLGCRLWNRIKALSLLSRIQSTRLCLRFNPCNDSCTRLHVNDAHTYTSRVVIELLKIRICHTIWGIEPYRLRRKSHSVLLSKLYEAIRPLHSSFGSQTNLDEERISEQTRHIVLQWIGESMYALKIDLDSSEPHRYFLTITFQLLFLYQWATSRIAVPPYLCKVPWATATEGPAWLMLKGKPIYVVPGILGISAVEGPSALSRAVQLIQHIVVKRVPIDVTVLLDVLDRICYLSLMAQFLQVKSGREVTLLNSWLQFATQVGADRLRSQRFGRFPLLAQLTKYFLDNLVSGEAAETNIDYVLYEERPCTIQQGPLFQMFVTRLCQILVFVGFNSTDSKLKVFCLSAIQKANDQRATIDRRIKKAVSWTHMIMVIRDRFTVSSLDGLVTIYHDKIPTQPAVPEVKCAKIRDIFPEATGDAASSQEELPLPLATAASSDHDERDTSLDTSGSTAQEILIEPDTSLNDPAMFDVNTPASGNFDDQPQVGPASLETPLFSAEEVTAARKIWNSYQRYTRKRQPIKRNMVLLRTQVYNACLEVSPQVPGPRYRYLYLGPFPHLYACLQSLYAHACAAAKTAKAQLNCVHHIQLEEAKAFVNQASANAKNIERLIRTLHPSSNLHKNGNIAHLQAHTTEIDELISKVPEAISGEWKADLRLAKAGIFAFNSVSESPKPVLNVTDVDPLLQ